MLPVVLLETPQTDADFDLDVRLQEVQHRISAAPRADAGRAGLYDRLLGDGLPHCGVGLWWQD